MIVLILAFILRFSHLGSRPLYQDEPHNTVELAAGPLAYIVSTNSGSILYPLLLHFLLPLADTEFMARLPAALFGFLSVWLIYLIGKILFGKKEALLAALLSALSGHFIYFSQQARGYSGLLFFALCSFYFFLRALKKDKRYGWGFYAFFTIIAAYMSFFALVIIPVQIFFLVVLLVEQRLLGKKNEEFALSNKKILNFSLRLIAVLVIFIVLVLVGESVHVRYGLLTRSLTSLDRSREISAALKNQVQAEEMIFADRPAAQLNFLFVKPLVYPNGSKKGVMVFERFHDVSQATLSSPAGLWILLNKSRPDEITISKWKTLLPGIQVERYSHGRLLHLNSPDTALREKLDLAIGLLLELPGQKENETAYHLFLAKIFLLAEKNQEAIGQLEAVGRTTTEAPPPLRAKREQDVLQKTLCQNIVTMLLDNADRARLEGKGDEALSLQKKAEDLSLKTAELRSRVYFSLAESYLRIGLKDEAGKKYQQALTVCRDQKDEDLLIKKIRELFSLPFGYIIWRQESLWRLRWWSDQRRTFSGEIAGSPLSKKTKKLRWTKDDSALFSGNKLIFRGVSDKGRIKGFDVKARTGSKLTFLLTIDGSKNIFDKIILADRGQSPGSIPFSLD